VWSFPENPRIRRNLFYYNHTTVNLKIFGCVKITKPMASPFIDIRNLVFRHPIRGKESILALQNVNLAIEEGEYVAIIGANGSGKTTLARHLNALLLPERGSVRVDGLDTRDPQNHPKIRSTVGMVFQTPEDQIVASILEEDVAFGPENLGLPNPEIRRRVEDALEITGMSELRQRPPHLLSAGQMQRAALAGVLAMRPRCVIFDETTAMLDPGGRRMVRELIGRLHRDGLTVIVISHFMREAVAADRIIVLEHGQVAIDSTPSTVFSHPGDLPKLGLDLPQAARLAEKIQGVLPGLSKPLLRSGDLLAALSNLPRPERIRAPGNTPIRAPGTVTPLIEMDGLYHTYMLGTPLAHAALRNASFHSSEGAIHGLIGPTGSGKSTLLQHMNGLLLPQVGRVRVGPYDLNHPKVDLKAVRRFAGLVFQHPEYQLFEQYVGDEIAYAARLKGEKAGLREIVRSAMRMVGLDFETYKDRLTFTLSGGERRKVALAGMLAMQPEILLLDEPTAGLDPLSRRETLGYLKNLNCTGKTLVLVSHHMEDVAELSSSVSVLNKGATVLEGAAVHVFEQVDLLQSLGMEAPLAAQAAAVLRSKGWPLNGGILKPDDLVDQLAQLQESGRE